MSFFSTMRGWFGGGAISETVGMQNPVPGASLVPDTGGVGVDGALQISTVWACISLRANIIASLPFFTYKKTGNEKTLAASSRLYALLSDSPNSRMTPYEFWRAMMMNYDLRGNAYARIDRDMKGEAFAIWPMPADQITDKVLEDGTMIYEYMLNGNIAILAAENVLHIKNLGNGTTGLAKLDFMRSATDEAAKMQGAASKIFGSGGKPTGILMVDSVLKPEQRTAIAANFSGMAEGNTSRLYVLEANMEYKQISISPEDQQLLESRNFGVQELARWFEVPAVLINHPGAVQYGNTDVVEDIFYKTVIMPLVENIEQAWRKRVMTPLQRSTMTCEMSMDALLRGSMTKRSEIYAKGLQNGWISRAEVRQLEGWPYVPGSDDLTAQSNLVPLFMLGKTPAASGGSGADIAQ
ncbi:MAG: phage portal protein [Janthinobacterium lividum]